MGRTALQQETAATTQIEIDPEIAAKLSATLSMYQDLKLQRDLLDEAMAAESKKIQAEMELLGVDKLQIEGVPCTVVHGTSSSLDKQKFVALGGSLTMLQEATITKPRKAYLRIGATKKEGD